MIDFQGFLITILPIALSPGASFTLAMSNVAHLGVRGSFSIIAGTALGIYLHAVLVGLGVTQMLSQNESLMQIISVAGLIFLLWLSCKLVVDGIRTLSNKLSYNKMKISGFGEALSLNLLNVKAIVLYLTVVPIYAGGKFSGYLMLSSMHVLIMALWLLTSSYLLNLANGKYPLKLINGGISFTGGLFLGVIAINGFLKIYN